MYGYVYKITNKLNGKIYVGKRASEVFDEKYWGSGRAIKNSINKYGINNFTREILQWYNSDDELNTGERFWINKLKSNQKEFGYNFTDGGTGGNTIKYLSEEEKVNRLNKIAETKANYSEDKKLELHNKLSIAASTSLRKLYDSGYENNNKGRKWYTNGIEDKMCFECPEGYWAGRTHNNIDYSFSKSKLKGRKWYNNGSKQVWAYECPNSEGWVEGMLQESIDKANKNKRGKATFNNGEIEKHFIPGTEPDGFIKGRLPENIKKCVDTRLKNGTYIPTEKTKQKISASVSKLWEDDTYRELQSNGRKKEK